jgi:signal peptidase
MKIERAKRKKSVSGFLTNVFFWAALVIFLIAVSFVALGKSTENIYVFGYKPFIIVTGSMETEYMTNSMIIIKKDSFENIKVGDVVAFQAESMGKKLAFHRVVDQVGDAFVTKGDNNNHADEAYVTRDNFIGSEVFHTNVTAYWINELHRPLGWIRMILLPILAIAMFMLGIYLLDRWTKNKTLKWLVICVTLLLASVTTLVLYNIWDGNRVTYLNEKLSGAADTFLTQGSSGAATINNREIIGVVTIEKISVNYPIIKYDNDSSLDISIAQYSGPSLNENGNVVLLGHRSANGGNLFFTGIDQLAMDDIVKITDKSGQTSEFKVVEYNVHTPDDLSVLKTESDNEKELTLISCSKDLKNRYVVRLVERK